jgi:hypothetical protein
MHEYKISNRDETEECIRKWHYEKTFPNRATHCFAAVENNSVVAAAVFAPTPTGLHNVDIGEFVAYAHDPEFKVPMSQFVKYCIGQIRTKKVWPLVVTYCESWIAKGVIFKGCYWNYDGQRGRAPDGVRVTAPRVTEGGSHLYWKIIRKNPGEYIAAQLDLQQRPYP